MSMEVERSATLTSSGEAKTPEMRTPASSTPKMSPASSTPKTSPPPHVSISPNVSTPPLVTSPTLGPSHNKVSFPRPPLGGQAHATPNPHSAKSPGQMQRRIDQALRKARKMLPPLRREDMWLYAAAYVVLYTVIMLFRKSTFGFICMLMYTTLVTLLALRYVGQGPLADQPNGRLRS